MLHNPYHLSPTRVRPANRMIGILLALLLSAATSLALPGCAEKTSAPGGHDHAARLTLMQPAQGDTVAGVIRCVAEWEGTSPPESISFLANGEAIGTAAAPPWEAFWRPSLPPPGGMQHRLGAQAWVAGGVKVDAAQVIVWVVPDSAPRITLDPYPRTIWVHRDLVESIRASAYDPEDGPLPGDLITWTGSHITTPVTGECLYLTDLTDLDQTVTATALDSRGQEGSATLRMRPFRPVEPSEPDHCRFNLEAALQAMDLELLEEQLAAGFIFVPCRAEAERAGWSFAWQREEFLRALRAWAERPTIRRPEWAWTPGPLMIWSTADGRQAWQQCMDTSLRFESSDSGRPETALLARGEAALWMSEDAMGKWRILEWRDLPCDNEVSLASVLAAALGMPTPEPGLGCAPPPSLRAGRESLALD